jgi:hypothetical protein
VELVLGTEPVKKSLDVWHSTLQVSHLLSREVGMATSTIPILEELRLKRYVNVEIFSNSAKKIS